MKTEREIFTELAMTIPLNQDAFGLVNSIANAKALAKSISDYEVPSVKKVLSNTLNNEEIEKLNL